MSGSPRENVGKKDAKALRNASKVPCVLYGGNEQVHFAVDDKEFKNLVYTPNTYTVNLEIGGNKFEAILQDIQYHPVSDKILHADFKQIFADKPVVISVPVKTFGTSPGVLKGGKLVTKFRKLVVKALPAHLPDQIDVSISNLDINDVVKVADLKHDNVTFLDLPSSVVTAVRVTRAVVEETPGAPAAAASSAAAPAAAPAKKK